MEKEHLEVLLEDIRGKVEMVAEGYDLLNRKIDRFEANLSEKIGENTTRINLLNRKIDRVAADLAETREELTNTRQELTNTRQELNAKIDKVAANLQAHRDDTESHRGYLVAEG